MDRPIIASDSGDDERKWELCKGLRMKEEKSMREQIVEQSKKLNPEQKKRGELIVITWDNPKKKDSSEMFDTLKKLGKVKKLYVKTTAVLWPKENISYDNVKSTIQTELSTQIRRKGRAVIVSLSEDRIAHIDLSKSDTWKKGYPKDI